MQFRKTSTKRFKWANLQHFRVTHPLRIPDRWDFIVFSFFCLPFYYSVLEYREDISHLNLTPDFIYICIYPEQKKKKGKKERKGRKKITVAFPPAIPSVSTYFLELGMEDRPLLLFQSWLLLGLSWCLHLPCDYSVWKHVFFVLYYQIHVLSVEQWRKNIKLFKC